MIMVIEFLYICKLKFSLFVAMPKGTQLKNFHTRFVVGFFCYPCLTSDTVDLVCLCIYELHFYSIGALIIEKSKNGD